MVFRSTVDEEYSDYFTADDDRQIVIGSELMWLLDECPDDPLTRQVLKFLDQYLDEPEERALFKLCSRLKGKKVVPLR